MDGKEKDETLDFTHGEPLENLSITTHISDHVKQDSISPPTTQDAESPFPPNAPPMCKECE